MPLTKTQKEMYERFMDEFPFCFSCGWSGGGTLWGFPKIDNAHIIGGAGRKHDRRDIIRLCHFCHRVSHGDTIKIDGKKAPQISLENMLWLKFKIDAEHYDREYLREIRMQYLPPAAKPNKFYETLWGRRFEYSKWNPYEARLRQERVGKGLQD